MTQLPTQQKKPLWKKAWAWILLIVVVLIVFGIALGFSAAQESKKKSLSYLEQTVEVATLDLERTISATGAIEVDHSQALSPLVAGTVSDLRVAVGDLVTKDQVLFTIDSLLPATAAQKEVKAPFDGRVLAVTIFKGGSATPGVPSLVIGYRSTHIAFTASDAEVVELRAGQEAHITVPSVRNGRDVYTAEVSFVDIQKTAAIQSLGSQQATSGYVVHVTSDALPEELRNRIGLVIDLDIVTDTASDVVAIDRSAIQYDEDDKPFVYRAPVLDDAFYSKAMAAANITDVLEKVTITTGFEGDDSFEVVSGLSVGDTVLLYVPKSTTSSPF